MRDQFGGDRQALVKTLEDRGITMADWKKKYSRDLHRATDATDQCQAVYYHLSSHD